MTVCKDNGVIDTPSNHSIEQTVERLRNILNSKIHLRATASERYGLVVVLDGKTKQASIFIGGDQLEGPTIVGFLGIGAASL